MTDASTQGVKTVLHPVSDLAAATAVYTALLGVPPQHEADYYVGFEAAGQHIGLVPDGGPQGMTSPVAHWHVADIEAKLAALTAAGATLKDTPREVGGGRLVATVTDPDGNVLGLLQGQRSPAMPETKPATTREKSKRFTADERAAMRARAKELKAAADGETALREALAAMAPHDRALGERLHTIVSEAAPELTPKTWYGMPAYANKDGKVVCFFRNATKFKERYAMLGFNDSANLDQGAVWPVAYAITELTATDEKQIRTLVKKAVS